MNNKLEREWRVVETVDTGQPPSSLGRHRNRLRHMAHAAWPIGSRLSGLLTRVGKKTVTVS